MHHRFELDGIRAIAISAAVLSHTQIPYTLGGWVGVDIFFVLSGFLITTILMNEWNRNGNIRLGKFYMRRVLRLYPALLLMLSLGVIFYRYLGNNGTLVGYRTTALLGATYTEDIVLGFTGQPYGGLGHTWSLAIEEQFYLLWAPILLLCLKLRRSPVILACLGIVASSISLVASSHANPVTGLPNTYYRPDTRANELMLGCLLSFLFARYGEQARLNLVIRQYLAPLSLIGLIVLSFYCDDHGRQFLLPQEEIGAALLSGGLVFGVMVGPSNSPLNWLLARRPLVWLGKVSYGVYLFFIPVFVVLPVYVHPQDMNYYVFLVIELACLMAIVTASFYLWERRFLALKDHFSSSAMSRPTSVARVMDFEGPLIRHGEEPS